jgi:hypothetical protein
LEGVKKFKVEVYSCAIFFTRFSARTKVYEVEDSLRIKDIRFTRTVCEEAEKDSNGEEEDSRTNEDSNGEEDSDSSSEDS